MPRNQNLGILVSKNKHENIQTIFRRSRKREKAKAKKSKEGSKKRNESRQI
jgi:hypothetical protein